MPETNSLLRTVLAALLTTCAAMAGTGHAQIAFRAAASAGVASSTTIAHVGAGAGATSSVCPSSITPAIPAGVAGDILIALVASKDSATLTPSAGWNTLFTQNPVTAFQSKIYWRVATGADALTVSKTGSGCNVMHGRVARFRGVHPANPFESGSPVPAANWSYQNATSVTSGTDTPTSPNSMLLFALLIGDNNATDASGLGFTESFDSGTSTGTDVQVALNYRLETTAGTKGPFSVPKGGGSDPNHGVLFALRPVGSTLTINVPAGTTTNDVMVASIAARPCSTSSGAACTLTVVPPAGWTLVNAVDQTTGGASGGFGQRLFVYQKVVIGAEPASYTWLFGGTPVHAGLTGGIVSFSGVDTTSPIVASGGQTTASSTSHTAPSVSTGTVANTWLVTTHSSSSSALWTAPAGMTERVDIASLAPPNDLGLSIEMNTEVFAGTGATGTRTATYTAPAPAADTGATHTLALRPAATVNHFSISHTGTGVACDDQTITFTAHDASHNAVGANALAVTLSTSNGRGTWTGIVAGGGALSDPTPGDGAATYTFAAGSTSVSLSFRYANLAATSETFSFNISGGGFSETTGAATAADDPSFTMAQAGFQFRNVTDGTTLIGPQIAGKPSDSGFNAKVTRLRAIRTDTATGACTGLFGSQSRTVDLAAECNNASSCAGRQVNINGTNIATSNDNGGAGAAAYTGISLAFNASSEADLSITYPDAGRISLHARYDLDTGVAGFEMTGSSNVFVVRPFGLRLSGPGIPGVSGPGGAVFKKAGENFDVTVTAVGWQLSDDGDNDGAPDSGANLGDNAALPNFGQEAPAETVTVSHTLVAPAAGAGGALSGTLFSGFAGGARTNAMSWSEVGSISLSGALTSANYLGAGGNAVGSVSPVGRFIPDHFFLVPGAALTNRSAAGCVPASSFTYLGEGLGLSFSLQARNTAGDVTQNYTTASGFAKLDPATTTQLGFGALSGATNLTPRIGSASASGSFVSGAANITASLAINRAASPDGPFTGTRIGIAPADSDAVMLRTAALDLDVDGAGGNDHQQTGSSTELRFGRLRLNNAAGSSVLDLPIALETQYYNGVGFARNTADSCTAIPVEAVGMTNFTGQLAACETALQPSTGNFSFTAGRASSLKLRRPGDGNQGSVDINVNLNAPTVLTTCTSIGVAPAPTVTANLPFLRGNWGSGSFNQDPVARATFGVFKNAEEFIYFRENF